jgi:hypothetical protein
VTEPNVDAVFMLMLPEASPTATIFALPRAQLRGMTAHVAESL